MAEPKPCFGRCANLGIRYRDSSKEHYLFSDPDKLKECYGCNLFTVCMFHTNNEVIKYLVRLVDGQGKDLRPRIR